MKPRDEGISMVRKRVTLFSNTTQKLIIEEP